MLPVERLKNVKKMFYYAMPQYPTKILEAEPLASYTSLSITVRAKNGGRGGEGRENPWLYGVRALILFITTVMMTVFTRCLIINTQCACAMGFQLSDTVSLCVTFFISGKSPFSRLKLTSVQSR